jgi:hypothetical protein
VATCEIRGIIQGLDETPTAEAAVRATVQSTVEDQSGQIVASGGVTSEPVVVFTDVNGQFSIQLSQSAVVELEIPAINLRKIIGVPLVAGPVDFRTLI